MSSWNSNNELFVVVAHSNGSFDAHWSLEAPSWDKKTIMQGWFRGDFDHTLIKVDRNEFTAPLRKVSVLSTGDLWLLIVDLTPSFLRSISNGSYMRFETGAVWSLYGSASALAALDQCRSRLGRI